MPRTFTRRRLLQTAALAAGWAATRGFAVQVTDNPMLIIDCHAHIYGEDEGRYPTIDSPLRPPAGTGTIAHLKREMAACGVRSVTRVSWGAAWKLRTFRNVCWARTAMPGTSPKRP